MHRTLDLHLPRLQMRAQGQHEDKVRPEAVDSLELAAIEMADREGPRLASNRPIFDPELESTFLRTGWVPRRRV